MLLKEYYKRPDATGRVDRPARLLRTATRGIFDGAQLKIIDRAKDVGRLTKRRAVCAQLPREQAQVLPHIKEAGHVRQRRDHVCAFINIDLGLGRATGPERRASRTRATRTSPRSRRSTSSSRLRRAGQPRARREGDSAASQIHRFLILHKELDPDDDELTRTRKVRRGFVAEKYAVLVDALYAGRTSQHIETLVKFEDGRSGLVAADLRIDDARRSGRARRRRDGARDGASPARRRRVRDAAPRASATSARGRGISLAFGGVKALTDISFDVREHEIRAIIGPNGAGKSSMLNVINGVYHPQHGTITYRGVRAAR
jgi:hypothetical protein